MTLKATSLCSVRKLHSLHHSIFPIFCLHHLDPPPTLSILQPISSWELFYCVTTMDASIKAVTGDQLIDKLSSLGMKSSRPESEGSFDYVEEKADSMDTPVNPTVSISTAEQWEKQLMKDPKVLSIPRSLYHPSSLTATTESPRPYCFGAAWKQCSHAAFYPN